MNKAKKILMVLVLAVAVFQSQQAAGHIHSYEGLRYVDIHCPQADVSTADQMGCPGLTAVAQEIRRALMDTEQKGSFGPQWLFPRKPSRWRMLEPDPEALELERQLREKNLIYNPEVQRWLRILIHGVPAGRPKALERLKVFLQADEVEAMRFPDDFRPYGPAALLGQGDLHVLDQQDGVKWFMPTDGLVLGGVLAGAQGGGKSRALVHICRQLVTANPPRHVLILDPKNELHDYAGYLNAVALDGSKLAFDLSPPPGTTYQTWLPQLLPQLGTTIGVVYGIEIIQEAGQICLEQLARYKQQTGSDGELCLQDIYTALPFVRNISSWRRKGYFDAVRTGINRILDGAAGMFTCRSGVPLQELFNRNVILGLPNLTDEFSCRWLAQYLLYWKFQQSRSEPPIGQLENLIVIDDCHRFLNYGSWPADKSSGLTSLAHVLAVLRTSGVGLIAASQLPAALDPAVLSLSSFFLIAGGVHGYHNQRVMAEMIGLNRDQQVAIGKLVPQECVGAYLRGSYRESIHGWVPDVPDPQGV